MYQSYVDLSPIHDILAAGETVLTPGLRLSRQLCQAWVSLALTDGGVAEHPSIAPVDAWLESRWLEAIEKGCLPTQRLLTKLEERFVWLSIINTDSQYANAFRLLQPQAAAEQARISRDAMLHFGPDNAHQALQLQAGFDVDCQTFFDWLQAFERILTTRGWATRADAYQQLSRVNTTELGVTVKPNVYLAHTLQLTPLTHRVLTHLANIAMVGGAASPESMTPIEGVRFASVEEELAQTAKWAARRQREGRESTAIVLMNFKRDRPLLEYYLRREFDCLDARYNRLPVNFATGQSLASVPMFRDALLALTLRTEALTRHRVEALLRSPYLLESHFAESEQGVNLLAAIYDLASETIDWEDFSHCVATCASESILASAVTALRDVKQQARQQDLLCWIEHFRLTLKLWQWPSRNALDSMEYQQLERFERSFDQLMALSEIVGEIDYTRAIALWRTCLEDMVFQPKTEPSALQVLGPQEAVGLSFDALHICGLQAGVLPSKPRLLPFIPAVLQRHWSIPDADATLLRKQADALLASWRATHGAVSASCFGWIDGVEQHSSALFEAYESRRAEEVGRPDHWRRPVTLEMVEDFSTQGRVDGPSVPFGGGANVLQNQSACAFRAWMRHRLGAKPLTGATLGLTAADRGSVMHYALHYFWGRACNSAELSSLGDVARHTLVQDAVAHAMRTLEARNRHGTLRKRVGSACLDLEAIRAEALLKEWLAHELDRRVAFVVAEREEEHTLTIGPLELNLRPDRIDELEDGRWLVIDYKTGNPSRSSWLGSRPSDPQLPLYVLLKERVEGVAFARVKRGVSEFIALGENLGLKAREQDLSAQLKTTQTPVDHWMALSSHWRSTLEGFAADYARGSAQIDPAPGACRFCELASVCRIGHQSDEIVDDEGQLLEVYGD